MTAAPDWSEPRTVQIGLCPRHIRFLKAPSEVARRASVIVGVAHRNHPQGLQRAVWSALEQSALSGLACVILDDSSDEGWMRALDPEVLEHPRVVVMAGVFGSPAHARNALLDLVDEHFPAAEWVARMDADDCFAMPSSLQALVDAGSTGTCSYVLGSNRLVLDGKLLPEDNVACPETLLNRERLNAFIQAFCAQEVPHELPSCNLLLRARSGIRYPQAASAEDHWLVAGLLMNRPEDGCVLPWPIYANYTLGGTATSINKRSDEWIRSRARLAAAAQTWFGVHQLPGVDVLGWGQEGVVWRQSAKVFKRFYPFALAFSELADLKPLAERASSAIIGFTPQRDDGNGALVELAPDALDPMPRFWPLAETQRFLEKLYRSGVVASNIKRDNLRLTSAGELQYIDVGRDIVPLTASRFVDCAAKLFVLGELGWSDHELARRKTSTRQRDVLQDLPGFSDFYEELIRSLHPECDGAGRGVEDLPEPASHADVTLLIKCCPQDSASIEAQVQHLAAEFRLRARFAALVVLVDPFEGPYLRQFDRGDLQLLMSSLHSLKAASLVDEIWVAPSEPEAIQELGCRWFGAQDLQHTHTADGAPVMAQAWAFDRAQTRYVLQMDVDVLVGGTDLTHDVIGDMKRACMLPGVWCVGFNIPQPSMGFQPYLGTPGQFAPEVRCGLLDLEKIKAQLPVCNPVTEGRLTLMWHRALQRAQPKLGMRSVRGGDSRTFYVHPRNTDKLQSSLPIARDLLGQGIIPAAQAGSWDWESEAGWAYPERHEDIVFLLLGQETPPDKLQRCLDSLKRQTSQQFGVVLIDDAGSPQRAAELPHRLAGFDRVTLMRRTTRVGYLANFREAVLRICRRPESLIVILDQDDALMRDDVLSRLLEACRRGADLINGPMFRPEKPVALYQADYAQPRQRGGGNVWCHLRAFRKSLFERVPTSAWDDAPDSDCLSDFLTMVPMAELAEQPMWMDGPYLYWHERTAYSEQRKLREGVVKMWLFTQPPVGAAGVSPAGRMCVSSATNVQSSDRMRSLE